MLSQFKNVDKIDPLQVESLGIRGNGLGLNSAESLPMTKGDEEGIWTLDIVYRCQYYKTPSVLE